VIEEETSAPMSAVSPASKGRRNRASVVIEEEGPPLLSLSPTHAGGGRAAVADELNEADDVLSDRRERRIQSVARTRAEEGTAAGRRRRQQEPDRS
jgi:hypothetical protein